MNEKCVLCSHPLSEQEKQQSNVCFSCMDKDIVYPDEAMFDFE